MCKEGSLPATFVSGCGSRDALVEDTTGRYLPKYLPKTHVLGRSVPGPVDFEKEQIWPGGPHSP
jgi:hypothetical protein